MKILLLQDAEWRKKGPHQQHHLMELLSLRGHHILIIGFDQLWRDENRSLTSPRVEIEEINRFHKNAKVKYIRPFFIKLPIFDYLSFFITSYIEIRRQIKKFQPNIIIGYSSILSNYWGALYARKNKIPYVYYWVDIVHTLSLSKPFFPFAICIEKIIIKKSNLILTINQALKEYLINFGAEPNKIKVIPGGVDFNRFNFLNCDPLDIRMKYGLCKDDFVLFFMGWIYFFSGLKEVIFELKNVKNEKPNLKFLIVGDGDYYSELKNIVKKNSLEDCVILTGKRLYEEIPELINAADICLFPAYNNEIMKDIVPIKMYEYLAMNKPVISTRLPGIIKEFGENSGVMYVDNSKQVIEKIKYLDASQILNQKQNAKNFIKNYGWDNIVDNFEIILTEMVDNYE